MPPLERTSGSAVVKIYKSPVKVKGKKYDAYLVRYYHGGKPIRKRFGKLEDAEQHAKEALAAINGSRLGAFTLLEEDAAALKESKQLLAPFGKGISVAIHDYVEALKIGGGIPVQEMARYYRMKHPEGFIKKTVSEVFAEMLKAKQQDNLSKEWLKDLRIKGGKFNGKFGARFITEIAGTEIDEFLRGFGFAPKTRNNYRIVIATLFSFAKSRRYLPKDFDEMNSVPVVKVVDEPVEIFTPQEMQKLLLAADSHVLPFLVFGAFAGLRTSEVSRLSWDRIKNEHIEIAAEKTKTARRRLVPIVPTLKSWISVIRKSGAPIWSWQRETPHTDFLDKLCKAAGVEWKHNALRHSFISYRLASIKNTAQVAHECGTSEEKIYTNYRELVTEDQAKEWFALDSQIRHKQKPKLTQKLKY